MEKVFQYLNDLLFRGILRRPVPGIRLHGDGDASRTGRRIRHLPGTRRYDMDRGMQALRPRASRRTSHTAEALRSQQRNRRGRHDRRHHQRLLRGRPGLCFGHRNRNHRRRPAHGHVPCRMGDTQAAGHPPRRHDHVDPERATLGLSRRHAVAWRHSGHGNNPLQQNRFPSQLKQRRRNASSESRNIPPYRTRATWTALTSRPQRESEPIRSTGDGTPPIA